MNWQDIIKQEQQKDYYKNLENILDKNIKILKFILQKIKYLMHLIYVNMII